MSLPFFPLYPSDFQADASHLSLAEDGALNRLWRLLWMTPGCSIPSDRAWVCRRMSVSPEEFETIVEPVIEEFLVERSGRLFSPRLSEEWQKAREKHARAVESGRKGGQRAAQIKLLKT